jgi:hypothetical protein
MANLGFEVKSWDLNSTHYGQFGILNYYAGCHRSMLQTLACDMLDCIYGKFVYSTQLNFFLFYSVLLTRKESEDFLYFTLEMLELVVCLFVCLFFAVLGLELRAFTLSHSTSPIFMKGFRDKFA